MVGAKSSFSGLGTRLFLLQSTIKTLLACAGYLECGMVDQKGSRGCSVSRQVDDVDGWAEEEVSRCNRNGVILTHNQN